MMGLPDLETDQKVNQSVEEEKRLLTEQIRLQAVMIELLNVQLRGYRSRIDRQTERIEDLKRMIRVRDDLLYLRNPPSHAAGGPHGAWRWLARLMPGSKRG